MPSYTGGCHCGAVRFEVTGKIEEVVVCNCSICAKTAYLHWEVEPAAFRRSRSSPDCIDINVRCLEGVDAESFPVTHFDGRSWD